MAKSIITQLSSALRLWDQPWLVLYGKQFWLATMTQRTSAACRSWQALRTLGSGRDGGCISIEHCLGDGGVYFAALAIFASPGGGCGSGGGGGGRLTDCRPRHLAPLHVGPGRRHAAA